MADKRAIVILHGPNLNLLGRRSPEIYGHEPFEATVDNLRRHFPGIALTYHQSNHEGQLIDWLHHYGFEADGIVLNAGAYAHTSIAIRDAIESITAPVVNIHISDIQRRESFRRKDMLADVCVHNVIGKGREGYRLAIEALFTE